MKKWLLFALAFSLCGCNFIESDSRYGQFVKVRYISMPSRKSDTTELFWCLSKVTNTSSDGVVATCCAFPFMKVRMACKDDQEYDNSDNAISRDGVEINRSRLDDTYAAIGCGLVSMQFIVLPAAVIDAAISPVKILYCAATLPFAKPEKSVSFTSEDG